MKITFDCETRSKVDLKKCGPWVYAEHKSTEIFCFAFKIDANPTLIWVNPKFRQPDYQGDIFDLKEEFKRFIRVNAVFEAHNAEFERAIWFNIMMKQFDCPEIPLDLWQCSAAKCAALSLPRSLENACKALELSYQKDMEGHRIMLRLCKPKKPSKESPGIWDEDPEKLKRNFDYCKSDVDAEYDLSENLQDLSPQEQRLWTLDRQINERGIHVDVESIDAILRMVDVQKEKANAKCKEITGYSGTQNLKIQEWLNENFNLGLENLTKSTVTDILAEDIHNCARKVLELRQQLSKSSIAKYAAMLRGKSVNNRVKGTTMFHGAGTGRWAGKRIQPHNMVRNCYKSSDTALDMVRKGEYDFLETYYGSLLTVASKLTRNVICAGPGNELICMDYASIESRFLGWLAGAEWKLEAFRAGKDLYKVAAAVTYGIPYEDITKDGVERQVGKVQELALGFQGGWRAFMNMASAYGVSVPDNIKLTKEDLADNKNKKGNDILPLEELLFKKWAQPLVYAWRDSNPEIVDLWDAYEWSALEALRTGKVFHVGKVKFGLHRGFLKMVLPSGRAISYYKPQLAKIKTPWGAMKEAVTFMGTDTKQGSKTYNKWVRLSTYGGKLAENASQGGARDIFAEAMPRLEAAGYPIIMHVHDEHVSEVKKGFGNLENFRQAMCKLPDWAKGLPLEADGWIGQRYRK